MRPSMQSVWMRTALILRERSTCKRLQVGCVITDKFMERVLGVGYNGGAKGLPHTCRSNEPGNCGDIHAEPNAHSKLSTLDREKIYFITSNPCEVCAKLIVNSGASAVYIYKQDYRAIAGLNILREAGIDVYVGEKWLK